MRNSDTKNKDKPSSIVNRDSRPGQWVPVEKSRKGPSNHIIERVPKAGHGDVEVKPGGRPPGNKPPSR